MSFLHMACYNPLKMLFPKLTKYFKYDQTSKNRNIVFLVLDIVLLIITTAMHYPCNYGEDLSKICLWANASIL